MRSANAHEDAPHRIKLIARGIWGGRNILDYAKSSNPETATGNIKSMSEKKSAEDNKIYLGTVCWARHVHQNLRWARMSFTQHECCRLLTQRKIIMPTWLSDSRVELAIVQHIEISYSHRNDNYCNNGTSAEASVRCFRLARKLM